jgi:hypothetical protein
LFQRKKFDFPQNRISLIIAAGKPMKAKEIRFCQKKSDLDLLKKSDFAKKKSDLDLLKKSDFAKKKSDLDRVKNNP